MQVATDCMAPANEDVIIAGVGREPRKSSRDVARDLRLSQLRALWSSSWRSIASRPLLAERTSVFKRSSCTQAILRMAKTSTRCAWALFTQHSVDRWSVFYAWEVHNSHLLARYPLLSPLQGQRSGWYRRRHCRGPLSATWQADCSTMSWFSWNSSTRASWRCACIRETEAVVSARRGSSALWGRYPAVAEPRKGNWTCRPDCMASSVAGSYSDECFSVEIPEGARLHRPSQDYRRYCGKTSSSCENGHFKVCSREFRAAHCRLP
jgi:hypothetical protein